MVLPRRNTRQLHTDSSVGPRHAVHAQPVRGERRFIRLFGAMAVASFLLHLFLTIDVSQEASDRSIRGRKLWFIGPFLWAFATFFGGVFTAVIYWVLHHSTLSPQEATDPDDV